MTAVDHGDRAVCFEAPVFSAEQSFRDPQRQAAELAARRRDSGFDEGFKSGWQAAEAEVALAIDDHRRSASRLDQCAASIDRAIHDLAERDKLTLSDIERDVVTLAVGLATEIIGHELSTVDEPVLEALARVVQLLPERGAPTLRIHPDDADTVQEAVAADIVRWTRDVEFIADPAVEPGGCIVEVGPCRIDGQIGPAIRRLHDVLG